MENILDIVNATWPIAVGFVGLVIVLAKMHYAIEVLNEKVKVLFELLNKMNEKNMDDGEDLEQQLQEIVGQLKETMLGRQKRIEDLRKEISEIEASNENLENTISDLLKEF